MKRSHYIILGVLAVIAIGIHGYRLATRQGPARHTVKDEALIGQRLADMVNGSIEPGSRLTVLFLYANADETYKGRTEALLEGLDDKVSQVHQVWAREEGHYDDFDYTESIDIALEANPQSNALLIVSLGTVTHATVSPKLKSFLKEGGQFYLSGSVLKDAPFTELARRGYAKILARRDTWVKLQYPAPEEADYAERHYVVIPDTTLKNDKS